ncbi:MAG: metallophosphoesterase [Pseudonocardiaceae bacterium]
MSAVLAPTAASAQPPENHRSAAPLTFALIGDTPYGPDQVIRFPALRADVNGDPKVRMVLHAGDIKGGSERCDDALFAERLALYNGFHDPFVFTPGDNEWTDCHRIAAGSYVPTERLEQLRRMFYPEPGWTTGNRPIRVRTQARDPQHAAYVENVLFVRSRVTFATVHVVGSRNDLEPWSGLPGGDQPVERLAEFDAREAAALSWIDKTFDAATRNSSAGVLLLLQAEPVADEPGYVRIRDLIARRAAEFSGPVLLVHGDEHIFEEERGYVGVPNLTRLETFGDTADHWLRVKVDPRSAEVFSWVPVTVPAAG